MSSHVCGCRCRGRGRVEGNGGLAGGEEGQRDGAEIGVEGEQECYNGRRGVCPSSSLLVCSFGCRSDSCLQ